MTNNPPSADDILRLPLAEGARYQLDQLDIIRVRARVYALNKDNAAGWKWRTTMLRAKTKSRKKTVINNLVHTLIVWRIK